MTSLEKLRNQKEALQLQLEVAELAPLVASIDAAMRQVDLREGFGDLVDRREYLHDTEAFHSTAVASFISDRTAGKDRVLFETEQQLAAIRGAGQALVALLPPAVNILEVLTNYTIGGGFQYEARGVAGQDASQPLLEAVQHVIDTFLETNDWQGDLDREVHARCREDGEALVALKPDGWKTRATLIEAACLTAPVDARPLEDWLGLDANASCWAFGVHSPEAAPATPWGYHVVYDEQGAAWDYFAAEDPALARRAGSGLLEHVKRGRRNVKRGVSEFYAVKQFLEQAEGVLSNSAHGARIQAAIAYIVEHAANVTRSQVSSLVAGQSDRQMTRVTGLGARTTHERTIRPGKVLHTPQGTQYRPAPMGSSNAPNFLLIEQALLRYAGLRWSMPEYMVSGDASNANYSSTLVAESPFVKSREADQRFFASRFKRIMWKAVHLAHDAGFFDRFALPFPVLRQQVQIYVTPPAIATRNALQDARVKEIEHRAGVINTRQWAAETGRAVQ